jgi:GTP diphosphokinase / guanosine-3',5'-bis(diphosphate) 3'-diphosphatase
MSNATSTPRASSGLPLLFDALDFAATKHKDQRRKDAGAPPYINHPIALLRILCFEASVEDTATLCAALLHDTIEDTETTASELSERFGETVGNIVQEVSDDKSLPKATRKQLQIEHAGSLSHRAKLVKLADKIANLRDVADHPPAGWNLERRREYFDWAKSVVDGIRPHHEILEYLFDLAYTKRP